MYLIDRENNADRDGSIILTPTLTKENGQKINNGYYFYCIHAMATNGHKYQNTCQEGLITISKIIGIQQCARKLEVFKTCFKVQILII